MVQRQYAVVVQTAAFPRGIAHDGRIRDVYYIRVPTQSAGGLCRVAEDRAAAQRDPCAMVANPATITVGEVVAHDTVVHLHCAAGAIVDAAAILSGMAVFHDATVENERVIVHNAAAVGGSRVQAQGERDIVQRQPCAENGGIRNREDRRAVPAADDGRLRARAVDRRKTRDVQKAVTQRVSARRQGDHVGAAGGIGARDRSAQAAIVGRGGTGHRGRIVIVAIHHEGCRVDLSWREYAEPQERQRQAERGGPSQFAGLFCHTPPIISTDMENEHGNLGRSYPIAVRRLADDEHGLLRSP